MNVLKYSYYDTPDGKDYFPKLLYTTKIAGGLGLVLSTYDVMLYSHPKTYGAAAGRYIYLTSPLVGMAAAFTSATYLATTIRKKDDEYNYMWGGIAAGSIFGAWQKSILSGVKASFTLAFFLMFKKNSVMEGWKFFPDPMTREDGGVFINRRDFTLMKEREPNWTTNPNEA